MSTRGLKNKQQINFKKSNFLYPVLRAGNFSHLFQGSGDLLCIAESTRGLKTKNKIEKEQFSVSYSGDLLCMAESAQGLLVAQPLPFSQKKINDSLEDKKNALLHLFGGS